MRAWFRFLLEGPPRDPLGGFIWLGALAITALPVVLSVALACGVALGWLVWGARL